MNIIGLKNIRYELDRLNIGSHIIFVGGRGTGKTSLAEYTAQTHNTNLIFLTGNTLKLHELLNIFIKLKEGDIILIDEIHSLNNKVEEVLYRPMSSCLLPITTVGGLNSEYKLPKFTLIGTTTKPSAISKPLISRFNIMYQIPNYNIRDLSRIIQCNVTRLTKHQALLIAQNVISPRDAINLAKRVMALGEDIERNLEFIGYKYGLSSAERYYLQLLYKVGKMSLINLSSALQIEESEIHYIEDKLIRKGYVQVCSRGRTLTLLGMLKLKQIV